MKTFIALAIVIILITLLNDGCCSVKESMAIDYTDSLVVPGVINASTTTSDEEQINQKFQELYDIISMQRDELDTLRGKQYYNDTVFTTKYVNTKLKSSNFRWTALLKSNEGDSLWLEHLIIGSKSIFNGKVIARKIPIQIPHTTITIEYQEPWYEKIWNDFKDFILGGIIFLLLIILVVNKVRG